MRDGRLARGIHMRDDDRIGVVERVEELLEGGARPV
jgi:hypothetical protein